MDGGPPPYVPPGQRTRRSRNDVLPPLPSYEDATKMPPLRHHIPSCDEGDQVVLDGQSSPIDPALPRQESTISNSSQSSSDSAPNPGRACSIECDSENRAVIHPVHSESRNFSEQIPEESDLTRESSVRKSL